MVGGFPPTCLLPFTFNRNVCIDNICKKQITITINENHIKLVVGVFAFGEFPNGETFKRAIMFHKVFNLNTAFLCSNAKTVGDVFKQLVHCVTACVCEVLKCVCHCQYPLFIACSGEFHVLSEPFPSRQAGL